MGNLNCELKVCFFSRGIVCRLLKMCSEIVFHCGMRSQARTMKARKVASEGPPRGGVCRRNSKRGGGSSSKDDIPRPPGSWKHGWALRLGSGGGLAPGYLEEGANELRSSNKGVCMFRGWLSPMATREVEVDTTATPIKREAYWRVW